MARVTQVGFLALDANAGTSTTFSVPIGPASSSFNSAYSVTQGAGLPNYIPIYSVEDITIERSQNWEVSPIPRSAVSVAIWMGADLMTYNFDIQLMIGWGEVADADGLQKRMKLFNAMLSHQLEGTNVQAPPACRFVLPGIIEATGVLRKGSTKFLKPWAYSASGQLTPLGVRFCGEFAFLPGYNQRNGDTNAVDAMVGNDVLSLKHVSENFYKL